MTAGLRIEWPGSAGPFERDGEEVFPLGASLADMETELRNRLGAGHAIGMRDAAGRLSSVVPGHGVVVGEVIDLSGLTAATVYAPEHARTMSMLWAVAAEVAEQRQLAGRPFPRGAEG